MFPLLDLQSNFTVPYLCACVSTSWGRVDRAILRAMSDSGWPFLNAGQELWLSHAEQGKSRFHQINSFVKIRRVIVKEIYNSNPKHSKKPCFFLSSAALGTFDSHQ